MLFAKAISRLKRTRVQILLGFITVMLVVLAVSGGLSYRLTSELFIENTKSHLSQTAAQASGRIDAMLAQIDSITMLLVMDARVQQMLYRAKQGGIVPVEERLMLRPIVADVGSLSWLIAGIDLYTEDEPLYPLENRPLIELIGQEGLDTVHRHSGQLVWFGVHPDDPSLLIAVRQVRLEHDYLSGGGYLVVKAANSLEEVFHTEFSVHGSSMSLFDQNGKLIATTLSSPSDIDIRQLGAIRAQEVAQGYHHIILSGEPYLHIIENSLQVNWSIHILVPLRTITDELSGLRTSSLYALVCGAAVCLILTWFLSQRITQPIRKLRRKMSGVHIALPQTNEETYFNLDMNELNQAYNKLVRDLHRLIETVYEKERLRNRAEIKMLQAQIEPHFLFNTLESLYWKLEEKDRESAGLVIALAKLFRYSLKSSKGDDWVTLSEEIEHCRQYLEIMKYRLAHRLNWNIRLPEELGECVIPKLLVQPLVENAIQHGIERKIGAGTVSLEVRTVREQERTVLRVIVRDDGKGMEPERLEKLRAFLSEGKSALPAGETGDWGIGLMNVARRIHMHYGDKYGLAIRSSPTEGTEIFLDLPHGGDAS